MLLCDCRINSVNTIDIVITRYIVKKIFCLFKISKENIHCYFSDFQHLGVFLKVVWFPIMIKLTPTILLKFC